MTPKARLRQRNPVLPGEPPLREPCATHAGVVFSLSLSLARASNARSWSHTERRRWQRFENQGSCGRNESNGRLYAALINRVFSWLAATGLAGNKGTQPTDKARRQDKLRQKRKQLQVVCCTDQPYVQMARSNAAERQTTARATGQDCWD